MTTETKRMRIYRMIDGTRVPFTLVLDRTLTVVEELVDEEALARVKIGRDDLATTGAPIEQELRAVIARWVTPEVPNPLPGTDELREEYWAALNALVASYGGQCPGCVQGDLIRSYRDKLEEAGHFK